MKKEKDVEDADEQLKKEDKGCLHNLYNNGKVSVCLSVRVWVTNFQSNPYLSCFKSEFEALKGKLGLLIK